MEYNYLDYIEKPLKQVCEATRRLTLHKQYDVCNLVSHNGPTPTYDEYSSLKLA